MKRGIIYGLVAAMVFTFGLYLYVQPASGQAPSKEFSLQVTPSPLIGNLEPGKTSDFELKIKNTSQNTEKLKLELRAFKIDDQSGGVTITDDQPDEVTSFISFQNPSFSVEGGQWHTERLIVNTPREAGFSYNFAILISRQNPSPKVEGGSSIEGSVAVFTLLSVNRPDAVKKLELTSFSSSKKMYEYLPADFELKIRNSGNTIAQPKGNIFISRKQGDKEPLKVVEINPGAGYTIPKSTRIMKASWNEGFPSRGENGKLIWDFSKLSQLRIGKYTANAVLIYDDGQRDIPINATISFWVIPWKLILVLLVILVVLLVGFYTVFRGSFGLFKATSKKSKPTSLSDEDS